MMKVLPMKTTMKAVMTRKRSASPTTSIRTVASRLILLV
jgi:hypothetical protein